MLLCVTRGPLSPNCKRNRAQFPPPHVTVAGAVRSTCLSNRPAYGHTNVNVLHWCYCTTGRVGLRLWSERRHLPTIGGAGVLRSCTPQQRFRWPQCGPPRSDFSTRVVARHSVRRGRSQGCQAVHRRIVRAMLSCWAKRTAPSCVASVATCRGTRRRRPLSVWPWARCSGTHSLTRHRGRQSVWTGAAVRKAMRHGFRRHRARGTLSRHRTDGAEAWRR